MLHYVSVSKSNFVSFLFFFILIFRKFINWLFKHKVDWWFDWLIRLTSNKRYMLYVYIYLSFFRRIKYIMCNNKYITWTKTFHPWLSSSVFARNKRRLHLLWHVHNIRTDAPVGCLRVVNYKASSRSCPNSTEG